MLAPADNAPSVERQLFNEEDCLKWSRNGLCSKPPDNTFGGRYCIESVALQKDT